MGLKSDIFMCLQLFDLKTRFFYLRKIFALPNNLLKPKNFCTLKTQMNPYLIFFGADWDINGITENFCTIAKVSYY